MIDEPLARGDSPMHSVDPRAKLVACLALSVLAALASRPVAPLVVLAAGLAMTLLARAPWRLVCARLGTVNFFVLFLWLALPVTAPGEPWRHIAGIPVT